MAGLSMKLEDTEILEIPMVRTLLRSELTKSTMIK